jgi:hypothetical protein
MGAAEFEYGAVPEAVAKMYETPKMFESGKIDELKIPVYVMAPKGHMKEVKKRIVAWSKEGCTRGTKENVCLYYSLEPEKDPIKICGWIELNNPFMFFTDKKMYEDFCDLLSIKVLDDDE